MDDWHRLQSTVSELGGMDRAGVLLGLSIVALLARRAWRRAVLLVALLLAAIGVSLATKVAYYAWGLHFGLGVFRGASGHSLRASALYPSFAWAVFAGSSRRQCVIALVVATLLACAVTCAMIDPTMHTPIEAIVGALLGAMVPLAIARAGPLQALSTRLKVFLLVCAGLYCFALPPKHFYDFESGIDDFSQRLHP